MYLSPKPFLNIYYRTTLLHTRPGSGTKCEASRFGVRITTEYGAASRHSSRGVWWDPLQQNVCCLRNRRNQQGYAHGISTRH
jgi:hypothetical protein